VEPYGVFWLRVLRVRPDGLLVVENLPELGKRDVEKVEKVIEPHLVFPAVRGRDIQRWRAVTSVYVLLTQDPEKREGYSEDRMRQSWPKTYSYLRRFSDVLLSRGSRAVRELAERTVPWTMYGIGEYTFAPYRVAWKRMAADFVAVVLSTTQTPFGERPLLATDTVSLIPTSDADEAHYICALVNSAPLRAYVRSFSSAGRGFGTPSVIGNVALPSFDRKNDLHQQLANLSWRAHDLVAQDPQSEELRKLEAEIDRDAAGLWGIDDLQTGAMRAAVAAAPVRVPVAPTRRERARQEELPFGAEPEPQGWLPKATRVPAPETAKRAAQQRESEARDGKSPSPMDRTPQSR
jgi:hypothetical protein